MNDEFVSIKKGLENAIDHASGKKHTVRLYKPEKVNVKLLRKKSV